jgi:hypothetical protein
MTRSRGQVGGQPSPALREDHPVIDRYESTLAWLHAGPLIYLSDRTLISPQRSVVVVLNSRARNYKYLCTMYTLHEKLTFDPSGAHPVSPLTKDFAFSF